MRRGALNGRRRPARVLGDRGLNHPALLVKRKVRKVDRAVCLEEVHYTRAGESAARVVDLVRETRGLKVERGLEHDGAVGARSHDLRGRDGEALPRLVLEVHVVVRDLVQLARSWEGLNGAVELNTVRDIEKVELNEFVCRRREDGASVRCGAGKGAAGGAAAGNYRLQG